MHHDWESLLELTRTDIECRDCPLWKKDCQGIAGDGGCYVPNEILDKAAQPTHPSLFKRALSRLFRR